ncbi:patatin [Burkholderia pseudomallei]|uniref:patatin-like phospholipase family protein n=1 Tax=Burkholderia pseudomallei TaxID=28450 RepID=UPI0009B57146|nr:patatin-like phospholipase family protein [Burkholderia pseudomallei]MBF3420254.1 patatin-like phospholipase family protein [Burkholderia pseudomallei]MBF3750421.1 patatin-like phospholipase family protein [Burkholderia pseudomallei]MBF4088842.1 patatin-like phospholipase family protein [Burkholderia pseudomallei]MWJ56916.1 patatin [Burkholderia pseudomallei]VBT14002.1 putative patatin-like phospholipase [Burkholderia pseudomallei]
MTLLTTSDDSEDGVFVSKRADGKCRILALDGGGAKGFYTLGVLKQIELMLGRPLHEYFDYVYGTSTGAIIATLVALGYSVDQIHDLYTKHVPTIMKRCLPVHKTNALEALANQVFGSHTPSDFKTGIGVVATKWMMEQPMIFKGSEAQLHGRKASFHAFHGVGIADAVQASCSAYPLFKRKTVKTWNGDLVELIDGGYCANNPALYAIADAVAALRVKQQDIRLISIGVGMYPESKRLLARVIKRMPGVQLAQKALEINTQSMDRLRKILFKDIPTVRINQAFTSPALATDLTEHDLKKLNLLRQHGSDSFAEHEDKVRSFLTSTQV